MDKIDEGLAGLKAQIESLGESVDKLIAQRDLCVVTLMSLIPLLERLENHDDECWKSSDLTIAIEDARNAVEATR
jgi:hypothetical protein